MTHLNSSDARDNYAAPTVALKTVGCRTNQEEIAALESRFRVEGYRIVASVEDADVIVINTCSVTAHTESKTRRMIRTTARKAGKARLIITGCLAQQHREALCAEIHGVTVVGNAHKMLIPLLLRETPGVYVSELTPQTPVEVSEAIARDGPSGRRSRYSLKIQEGCDFSCSYCIVPRLRGPSRSSEEEILVTKFGDAVRAGFREIILTGTHIGQYRGGCGLDGLLSRLLSTEGDYRIRLSSLDPRDITGNLLARVAEDERICSHLHVSVQSLCMNVIQSMNRGWNGFESVLEMLARFRREYPFLALGGDFIVGFPGESEDMFSETVRKTGSVGFTYGHVFRYSPRPQTPAAQMDGQIPESEKTRRSSELRGVLMEGRNRFAQRMIGKSVRIIVEKGREVVGKTSNYLSVTVPGERAGKGEWYETVIERYNEKSGICIGRKAVGNADG